MFTESASWFDAVYDASGKDYRSELDYVRSAVKARGGPFDSILDIACGTGRHLALLPKSMRRVGVDINADLLDIARQRCPEAEFRIGDLTDLQVDSSFDVVSCLFSSIAYARTPEGLQRAIAGMASSLLPGGVLVVEPSFLPENWQTDYIGGVFVDEPAMKGARIGTSSRRGNIAILDLHYLVGTPAGVRHERERHELGLFTWDDYRHAFAAAGLDIEIDHTGPCGRGLITGIHIDGGIEH